ncbi:MAG: MBL fold metallo-hydrolase [Sulfuritalea sp.]|nr:MBL fold metallo-hydrolase [Sulfuritalea sp.]
MSARSAFLSVLLGWLLGAPVLAEEMRDHAAERVAPRTWVIHGHMGDPSAENQGLINNPAFVVTATGVVVIDPGSSVQSGRMVLRQIRKVTAQPVTHVLITHVHGDHWLGNQAFQEAFPQVKLMAHPSMIEAARGGQAPRWLELMERLTQGFTRGTRAVIPTLPLVDDQRLAIGGLTFHIHATPKAHSGTDIMIHVAEEGVLFLGDNVMNGRLGGMGDGSFRGNIAACDRALTLPARVFVPGHGRTAGPEIVRAYRDYLSILFEAVRAEYDKGKQDYEMKETLRAKLERYAGWSGFDLNLGRHIGVAVLEIEAM